MRIRWGFFFTLFFIIHSSAEAIDRIRVAVSNPNMPDLTLAVAQKREFLKDEGVEAEVIRMNPNVSITALASGDIDYSQLFGAVERDFAFQSYDGLRNLFNLDGSIPEDGLRLVIEQARKSAKINREISPSEVADLALLREVQSEIGTRRR